MAKQLNTNKEIGAIKTTLVIALSAYPRAADLQRWYYNLRTLSQANRTAHPGTDNNASNGAATHNSFYSTLSAGYWKWSYATAEFYKPNLGL